MGANESYRVGSIFESTKWLTRGQHALEQCRFDDARLAYAKALELVPDSIDALRGLGYALFQLRQLAESLETLERALRIDPSDLLSRLLMGRLCLRLQQPDGAVEHFQADGKARATPNQTASNRFQQAPSGRSYGSAFATD